MLAKIPAEGHIIQDSHIGNTHILISDAAFAGNTPSENQRVLAETAQASLNIILHNSHS